MDKKLTTKMTNKDIVLFDGVCNLCNRTVQRIINHDPHDQFRFGALQNEDAKKLIAEINKEFLKSDSIIFISKNKIYQKSSAALRIAGKMSGAYPLLYCLLIFPPFIRDMIYDWIARNRYRWFGKRDVCMVPNEELKKKFIF